MAKLERVDYERVVWVGVTVCYLGVFSVLGSIWLTSWKLALTGLWLFVMGCWIDTGVKARLRRFDEEI